MRKRSLAFLSTLLVGIGLAGSSALAQEDDAPPAKKPGVRITFLPPPLEGSTVSLGIYDKKGKLVRVLAREATDKNFTVGLNGFITQWDGKDDAGKSLPYGTYQARGYGVGSLDVEGVAVHGNDWITDDDSPHFTRVAELRAGEGDSVDVVLQTAEGAPRNVPIKFGTEASSPTATGEAVKIAEGKVTLTSGGQTRALPFEDGETAIDATIGAKDRVWVIVQTAAGREVRAYTLGGEFLRRLAYAPTDPQPQRILAARGAFAERWSEQIVILEENEAAQRVRSLALPQKPAEGDAPTWETVLEKSIWLGKTFDSIKARLVRPDGKPFAAEKEFLVKLINNPLLQDEPTTAHVNIGFNERGSFLQTTDGLPLRRITETPRLQWAAIGREGSGKLLTIFQSDGAAVEEFKARRLANMMAFDAGDYEWNGK